jgi:uncharacterized protein DUF6174
VTSRRAVPCAAFALFAACAHPAPAGDHTRLPPPVRDTSVVAARVADSLFADTLLGPVTAGGGTFDLQIPGRRDSLRTVLANQRAAWETGRPRDYRFLLRVACFCPGARGWLLMDVHADALQAWDASGRPVPLTDWNTLTANGLFYMLEQAARRDALVEVGFDRRWHFPAYIRTRARRVPDAWSIVEARGFRPR